MTHTLSAGLPDAAQATAVLERITDAFFALDAGWRFTYVNAEAERLLARARGELVGREIWEAFPEAVGSTFEEHYRLAMREQRTAAFEAFYPPLGSWFEVRAYPSPEGLSVYFRGVDERRATQERLRRSEERLRLALEAGRMGTYDWDIASGKISWSPATERMHGLAEGSFEGTFAAYQRDIHPEDRERVLATVASTIERAAPHYLLYRIVRPDGEVRWLEAHGQIVLGEDGRAVRLVGVCRDVTERETAEQERERLIERLERGEQRFRTLVQATAQIVWDRAPDGEVVGEQPDWSRFTGQTMEEARGWGWLDAVHPDDQHHIAENWARAIATRTPYEVEQRLRRHDGQWRYMHVRAVPVLDADGAVREWIGVHTDVTERREIEQQFRFLAEMMPQLVWTTTPEGYHDYYNQRWYDYTGMPREGSQGWNWKKFLHPEDYDRAMDVWARALRTGEPYEVEYRFREAATGEYRWFIGRALPLRDADGKIVRWFGTCTDIHAQKVAEANVAELLAEVEFRRRRLQDVIMQAPAMIAVMSGPQHVLEAANPFYTKVVANREIIGKPAAEAFPELGRSFIALLDRVYATGEAHVGRESPTRYDRDGDGRLEEAFFDFVYQPIRDGEGRTTGILTHAVEVTEQVLARREVERKAEELTRLAGALARSNRELDQFAYVASHDLKAPLRGIANLSQWIEEDLGDRLTAESAEHMRLLRVRVHRMEALIDGILAYSRAGRMQQPREMLDVGTVVREAIELLAPPAGTTVRIVGQMPLLEAERVPLQQVFMNLIGNAVKHAGAGATVEVSSREVAGGVEFLVRDDGPGIAPEYHDRIWGIFQTLEARDRVEGAGIGLAVVKKIVESRGGRVWLSSRAGEGAAFGVFWPRAQSEDESWTTGS